ncbi:retroviral-like aspartic protease family protein [Marinobacterium sp. D7]|uniref:retropepsin-like aspartic protease family protein n=1 Tax=Marinobacterium ramblicola TaxID=2849041 RepID=UPI001C2DB2AA|nr:retropepsin-like aspartic protease [Marinobacterium ramblicola]MBV1788315.1 retroviral-like aspartic protease family protein [Marinobacterium ramblicola]
MNFRITAALSGLCALPLSLPTVAADTEMRVPMQEGSATTFYVQASLGSLQNMDFMVDTGSGYTTINEETLAGLQAAEQAVYRRDLVGVLADGSEIRVPVYRLSSLKIGDCRLNDIEAAVFPGKTRQILGLSALKQVGTFTFSFDPPQLVLNRCPQTDLLAAELEP